MLILLYSLGYLFCATAVLKIVFDKNKNFSVLENAVLISAFLIPLGKLFYFHIPGFYGLKFSFLFCSVLSVVWLAFRGVRESSLRLMLILIIPLFSLFYIEDYEWVFVYQLNEDQKDSSLFRFFTICALFLYGLIIYSASVKRSNLICGLSNYFVAGVFCASLIGVFISFLVLFSIVSEVELLPVSVGVHIVNVGGVSIYRFNPGANVNEFSMLLAYGIFLLPLSSYSNRIKFLLAVFFLILEFFTLTRASWLSLFMSSFVFLCMNLYRLKASYVLVSLFVFLPGALGLIFSNDEVMFLLESRLSFDIGASGYERLEKFSYVFSRLSEDPFRLLFGYGWATNMYVHNVYLQLLYEIGLVGLLAFLLCGFFIFLRALSIRRGMYKASSVALLTFMVVVAFMHHNLYHVQTWFVLGLVCAISSTHKYHRSNERSV